MSANVETMLFELGRNVDFPRPPDVRGAVRARLAQSPLHAPVQMPRWRRLPALGAAAAVALGAVAVLVAPVREAVADLFGVPGIKISFVEELPPVPPADSRATDLRLGVPIGLRDLGDLVDFDVQAPTELGAPDELWFDEPPAGGAVSLVYYAGDGLPESGITGLGALLTQFSGTVDPGFSKKLIGSGDTSVEIVEIEGANAYFISGGDHVVFLIDENGVPRTSEGRLAGNTLIWEQDGLTFRLEADIGLARALTIARSLTEI